MFLHFHEKLLFSLWVMLGFAELKFKWFFHVVGSVNQVHVIHTWFSYCFTFEVNDLFISWLWEVWKLAMLPQIWLYA